MTIHHVRALCIMMIVIRRRGARAAARALARRIICDVIARLPFGPVSPKNGPYILSKRLFPKHTHTHTKYKRILIYTGALMCITPRAIYICTTRGLRDGISHRPFVIHIYIYISKEARIPSAILFPNISAHLYIYIYKCLGAAIPSSFSRNRSPANRLHVHFSFFLRKPRSTSTQCLYGTCKPAGRARPLPTH